MPEGDTIFRAARTLHRALAGQVVSKFETQLPALARVDVDTPLAGRTVDRVEATGKWMLMVARIRNHRNPKAPGHRVRGPQPLPSRIPTRVRRARPPVPAHRSR